MQLTKGTDGKGPMQTEEGASQRIDSVKGEGLQGQWELLSLRYQPVSMQGRRR